MAVSLIAQTSAFDTVNDSDLTGAGATDLLGAIVINSGNTSAPDIQNVGSSLTWSGPTQRLFDSNTRAIRFLCATRGAGESTYTFTGGGDNPECIIIMACWRGCNLAAPVGDSDSDQSSGSTNVRNWPSVDVAADGAALMLGAGQPFGEAELATPSGYTAFTNTENRISAFYQTGVSSGTVGAITETGSGTVWGTFIVVIAADAGGGGGDAPVIDHSSVLSFPVLCRRPANDNWKPPGRRSVAGNGQFRRSKSGLYLPRRLAA